jgi:hypothetical protein
MTVAPFVVVNLGVPFHVRSEYRRTQVPDYLARLLQRQQEAVFAGLYGSALRPFCVYAQRDLSARRGHAPCGKRANRSRVVPL